jgi:hypothetical protein
MAQTTEAVQPTAEDLDKLVGELRRSWKATLTVRRDDAGDIGYREIYLSLDGEPLGVLFFGQTITREIEPGPHVLKAHNTLVRKSASFTVRVGDHVRFLALNRPGWGTYSALALIVGFLGAGPLYLTLTREEDGPPPATNSTPGPPSAGS